MRFKEEYIVKYFTSRGWQIAREGRLFKYFTPPSSLNLPNDYLLEIPKEEGNTGFDNYVSRLIYDLDEMLHKENSVEDLKILFSKENSILKYRIFDADNSDGTIGFQKHIDSLDVFKKVLSQAVTFAVTEKPIFGEARFEVESYLNRCRALQTERGSYTTKIEIPNDTIFSAISKFETSHINNKLFDVIEFVQSEIIDAKQDIQLSENIIQDNINYINFELLQAIKDIYSKTSINNIEYQLASNTSFRQVETTKVQPRIPIFNKYLRNLKKLLLDTVPLEAIGYVKRLASPAPLHSTKNEIIIDAEISNNKETIKIILRSEEYLEAIEAHKNEWPINIKGMARQGKTTLTIYDLEKFEVLKK